MFFLSPSKEDIIYIFQTSKSGPQLYIQQRYYAAASKTDVESRVLAVCKAFDKITADKVISIDFNSMNSTLLSLIEISFHRYH